MASARRFHHVGVITDQVQPGEIYVPETRVYVTNPNEHPYRIEYLRFEPDSPVTGPVRTLPHMAFEVPELDVELAGAEVLLGPFRPMEGLRVAFILEAGAVFELMQFDAPSPFARQKVAGRTSGKDAGDGRSGADAERPA
jgi:hypothetical protein